jgi:hypothetical protein
MLLSSKFAEIACNVLCDDSAAALVGADFGNYPGDTLEADA